MSKAYSERVMRFRRAVYPRREGLTDGCRLLLLRLSDDMNAKCIVSVPRSTLADELGVAPARITEWVKQAKDLGALDTVRRGRPGVTAVYQGLVMPPPDGTRGRTTEVRDGVPSQRYAKPDHAEVRDGVPQENAAWYATGGSQVVSAQRHVRAVPDQATGATEESRACAACAGYGCPRCQSDEESA